MRGFEDFYSYAQNAQSVIDLFYENFMTFLNKIKFWIIFFKIRSSQKCDIPVIKQFFYKYSKPGAFE